MKRSGTAETRFYRDWVSQQGLVTFEVKVLETDLQVRARRDLSREVKKLVLALRHDLESYAAREQRFYPSLTPLPIHEPCPPVVRAMIEATRLYDVGPMAAVAGAIAEFIGQELVAESPELIIENGGDIWLSLPRPAVLSLYAGPKSPFSGKLHLHVDPRAGEFGQVGGTSRPASSAGHVRPDGTGVEAIRSPLDRGPRGEVTRPPQLGICTSSGTVGHSLSFGKADAVVTIARSAALADAAATSLCNRVQKPEDIEPLMRAEQDRGLLLGMVVAMNEHLAAWGNVELEQA